MFGVPEMSSRIRVPGLVLLVGIGVFSGRDAAFPGDLNDHEGSSTPSGAESCLLRLPEHNPEKLTIDVERAKSSVRLVLHRRSLRGPSFRVLAFRQNEVVEVPAPPVDTYRGHLADDPDSVVAATLGPDGLEVRVTERSGAGWRLAESRPWP